MGDFPEDLMAAVPMPLILIGEDERLRSMNPRAEELFHGADAGRHYLTVLRQPALATLVEQGLRAGEAGMARYVDRDVAPEAT